MQSFHPPRQLVNYKRLLEQTHETDPNWTWPGEIHWNVESELQDFYERWHNTSESFETPKPFPYVLELGVRQGGEPLLPFRSRETSGDKILITRSFDDMFYRLLYIRLFDKGHRRGAVLTGQPGIGKTTFLKFMLVRLISIGQVVLLHNSPKIYLFYRGKVYFQLATSGFLGLPKRKQMAYCPIWALIDTDMKGEEPPIPSDPVIWPVHATAPKPVRWRAWSKQTRAALLGMPLWSAEELVKGFSLQHDYDDFRSGLVQSLLPPGVSTHPATDDKLEFPTCETAITNALKILQMAREAEKNEDEDRGEAGQPQAPMDIVSNALNILVHNATEEFGFIPCVVYSGILQARDTMDQHANAVKQLTYTELQNIVSSFSVNRGLTSDISHRVVTVFPQPSTDLLSSDRWEIDFKSIRIARKVMDSMEMHENERLRELYSFFHGFPESSNLAGWFFEVMIHRLFSGSWEPGPVPQPIHMDRQVSSSPPIFSTDPPSSTNSTSLSPPYACARTVRRVDFDLPLLSGVTLEKDKYYIPAASNHPLFDSFIINADGHIVVISIFQMTITKLHKGSAKGYPLIRKIMRRVRQLLEGSDLEPEITVEYFLVCPKDESERQWAIPAGWDDNAIINNHRGECFCIRIPIPGHRDIASH